MLASAARGERPWPEPEQLSFASDGWHECVEMRISSFVGTGQYELSVRERAVLVEGRIDAYLVVALLEPGERLGGHAETPGARVVRRAVRDPRRMGGQGVQVLAAARQRHPSVDRFAVADDVQVVSLRSRRRECRRRRAIHASCKFHSGGTTQSSTGCPDGTSCTVSGIRRRAARSVSRTPSPVMLRQSGYSSATKRVHLGADGKRVPSESAASASGSVMAHRPVVWDVVVEGVESCRLRRVVRVRRAVRDECERRGHSLQAVQMPGGMTTSAW